MSAAAVSQPTASPSFPTSVSSLDALAAMSFSELERLYRDAPAPIALELHGRPLGRMLAVRFTRALSGPLKRFAASSGFPWAGKTFARESETQGRGINRIRLGGRHQLFGFITRVQDSAVDGRPCIALDYEQSQNPGFIQAIHDEIREVSPGLWLGPAMWKTDSGPRTVLWFALNFNTPDPQPPFALQSLS